MPIVPEIPYEQVLLVDRIDLQGKLEYQCRWNIYECIRRCSYQTGNAVRVRPEAANESAKVTCVRRLPVIQPAGERVNRASRRAIVL